MNTKDLCGKNSFDAHKKGDHDNSISGMGDEHGQCDAYVQADGGGEEQVDSSLGEEGEPDETFTALHRLVAHMESRPADLHVFGMGR